MADSKIGDVSFPLSGGKVKFTASVPSDVSATIFVALVDSAETAELLYWDGSTSDHH